MAVETVKNSTYEYVFLKHQKHVEWT